LLVLLLQRLFVTLERVGISPHARSLKDHGESATITCRRPVRRGQVDRLAMVGDRVAGL
jgi:hypothetical protein